MKLNWGVLSTGHIAEKFAGGVLNSRYGQLTAVASRSLSSAQVFAKRFKIPQAHGSYEELLKNPKVEAVYIATPHPFHAEWTMKAAKAGKHIFCEKPFTMNVLEAKKVIQTVKQSRVFLMEAFMYRCHPQTTKIVDLIRKGAIGKVRLIQASFSFNSIYDPNDRHFDPRLGGGAILDVGCYPVSFARLMAGAANDQSFAEPLKVEGTGRIGESGVDEWASATLKFKGDITAELLCGVRFVDEVRARILGTKGSILIPAPWRPENAAVLVQKNNDNQLREVKVEIDRDLYAWEADTAALAIQRGLRESPAMSWNDSLGNMKVLEAWRRCIKK